MKSELIPKFATDKQAGKGVELYCSLLDKVSLDVSEPHQFEPHQLVTAVMQGFETATEGYGGQSKKSLIGAVFEYAVGEVLIRSGLTPLYHQAQVRHVPLARFDWFLYHPVRPVSISCKTSARERWKQAAYEAKALKDVYPQANNYLITVETVSAINTKMTDAPQTIDAYIRANTPQFDIAISNIAQTQYCEAEAQSPILDGSILIK